MQRHEIALQTKKALLRNRAVVIGELKEKIACLEQKLGDEKKLRDEQENEVKHLKVQLALSRADATDARQVVIELEQRTDLKLTRDNVMMEGSCSNDAVLELLTGFYNHKVLVALYEWVN